MERHTGRAHGHIYEIKSAFILQPCPAALTEGIRSFTTSSRGSAQAMVNGAQKIRAYDSTSAGSSERFGKTV